MGTAQALRPAVEAFLYREARLIDEGQFDEWLTLFTEDAHYWCPSNRDDVDPGDVGRRHRELGAGIADERHGAPETLLGGG